MSSVVCSLRAGDRLGREFAVLVGGDAGVEEGPRCGNVGGLAGQGEAGVLELPDGLAKSLTFLHIGHGGVRGALGTGDGLHADDGGARAAASRIICAKPWPSTPPSRASAARACR